MSIAVVVASDPIVEVDDGERPLVLGVAAQSHAIAPRHECVRLVAYRVVPAHDGDARRSIGWSVAITATGAVNATRPHVDHLHLRCRRR